MPGILEGIRVMDMTVWGVGAGGGAFLADLGADVIHIEQLGVGDPMRESNYFLGVNMKMKGNRQMLVETANRRKRSMALDVKKPEGKQIIYDMVKNSDVFISNMRAESLKKHCLDYETLRRHNEDLIYLHSSGFGSRGPLGKTPLYDLVGMARSGLMSTCGDPDSPLMPLAGLPDSIGSIMVAYGVLAGIIARERWGIGQFIESSQVGGMMAAQFLPLAVNLFGYQEYGGQVRELATNPLYNWYRCKGGRWIALGCIQYDRHWPVFADAVNLGHLKSDPRFENADKARENRKELVAILDHLFSTRTCEEWEKILMKADLVCSRINKMQDLRSDPQLLENEFIVDYDHPELGPVKVYGPSVKYSKTPAETRGAAPGCGQHTDEVLMEFCGYTREKIRELKEKVVI